MEVKPVTSTPPPSSSSVYSKATGTNVADKNGTGSAVPLSQSANQANQVNSSDKGNTDVRRVEQTVSVEKQHQLQRQELEKVVESMEEFVGQLNRGLAFRLDEDSGRQIVTVYDKKSGEIVRQIPDEDLLTLSRQLAAHSGGLFTTQV
ncbi:flagellar biosynthesis protein FlaG [Photobacterium jeanii]|uniref:Flagellar biosynthesis protein FlaG n=1 Tax=Photobacterium jeanii TaxID=858640 RepID=A0A178KN44_9GAMM|nr:flagellar protein FlaG [Photobacterium jeanii]OAN18620.1 flagellar biosynthesis protein FlaG [Photobacterium jeanii]PST91700.1 flagellar biosynthesis protein FlaG [Photobacterium jeanii]